MDSYSAYNHQYANASAPSSQELVSDIPVSLHYTYPGSYPDSMGASLKVHAPVPLPGHSSILHSGLHAVDSYAQEVQENDSQFYGDHELDTEIQALCEPQETPINLEYCSASILQSTFQTPSELLAEVAAKGLVPTHDEFGSDVGSDTARKARRRAMAKSVGFVPTDPDTISSHEKKRHYLECLEQYITYLHQQFELVGETPPAMERVSSYRGLSSRSIRTLLVHMEHKTRRLNLVTLSEEQRFMKLRDDVCAREGSGARHE